MLKNWNRKKQTSFLFTALINTKGKEVGGSEEREGLKKSQQRLIYQLQVILNLQQLGQLVVKQCAHKAMHHIV